jgi:hypothetical protein
LKSRIDYVFYSSNSALNTLSVNVMDIRNMSRTNVIDKVDSPEDNAVKASDHAPVVATLSIAQGSAPLPTPPPSPAPAPAPSPVPPPAPTPAEFIIDNTNTANVTVTGDWTSTTYFPGFYGTNYIHDARLNKGSKSVRFTPNVSISGNYQIQLRWLAAADRANNIPVIISTPSGTNQYKFNQRLSGLPWSTVATVNLAAGNQNYVEIRTTGTTGYVIVDAVRFVPVP